MPRIIPGPWTARPISWIGGGWTVASDHGTGAGELSVHLIPEPCLVGPWPQFEGTALLIAAAPELMAALEAALPFVAMGGAHSTKTTAAARKRAGEVFLQAQAAIARAKGEGR